LLEQRHTRGKIVLFADRGSHWDMTN